MVGKAGCLPRDQWSQAEREAGRDGEKEGLAAGLVRISGSAAEGEEPLGRTRSEGAERTRDASAELGSRSVARGRRYGRRARGGAV